MPVSFISGFEYNRIVWICGLPPNERGPSVRVLEDLSILAAQAQLGLTIHEPTSRFEFEGYLFAESLRNAPPLIHIDSHGDSEGISVGTNNERISWKAVCDAIRPINAKFGNRALVISNCCFSMYAIFAISILQATPFQGFLGPTDELKVKEFERSTLKFYQTLLDKNDFTQALAQLKGYDFWLADQFLLQTLAGFMKRQAIGKGKERFIEELVSKSRASGKSLLTDSVSIPRTQIKNLFNEKTGPEMLESHIKRFLFGQRPEFTYEDLLRLAREA
tara:strand:- start:88 stop:915 length:828 start_codon:yes stop_codon:yes gene_type:complete